MTDDLVGRLVDAAGHLGGDAYLSNDGSLLVDAAAEIERLRAWKAQATEILARWDAVADTIDIGPNQLGLHKYDLVHSQLQFLQASNDGYFAASREWRDEYLHLHKLAREWADACDLMMKVGSLDTSTREGIAAVKALFALRKAVGR